MTEKQLLVAIFKLLVLMARWMMDSKDADYKTRATWFGLNEAIKDAEKIIEREA